MGLIFRVLDGKPVIAPTSRFGCWVEVIRDGKKDLNSLCKLQLDPDSPLTPRTEKMEPLPRPPERQEAAVQLDEGVWWCSILVHQEQYLVVSGDSLKHVTKAQAYCALGAVQALQQMGLEDAAVALAAGEFDLASVQVIAERERRLTMRG